MLIGGNIFIYGYEILLSDIHCLTGFLKVTFRVCLKGGGGVGGEEAV